MYLCLKTLDGQDSGLAGAPTTVATILPPPSLGLPACWLTQGKHPGQVSSPCPAPLSLLTVLKGEHGARTGLLDNQLSVAWQAAVCIWGTVDQSTAWLGWQKKTDSFYTRHPEIYMRQVSDLNCLWSKDCRMDGRQWA